MSLREILEMKQMLLKCTFFNLLKLSHILYNSANILSSPFVFLNIDLKLI